MKPTVRTSRTAGQLEKIFRALNTRFFNDELPEAVITLKDTPGAYGHFSCGKVWQTGEERRHEINLSTLYLDRPIESVVATLLHEQIHLYCAVKGIKDTSRGGSYHNKNFKKEAEAHGLMIDHDSKYGWTITSPSLELLDFIELMGWQDIQMAEGGAWSKITGGNSGGNGARPKPPKKPTNTRKYQCPCCGNSVRATKAVNILCMDCNQQMVVTG